jgi:hypothetical protein
MQEILNSVLISYAACSVALVVAVAASALRVSGKRQHTVATLDPNFTVPSAAQSVYELQESQSEFWCAKAA